MLCLLLGFLNAELANAEGGEEDRMVNYLCVSLQYLDLQFDYISGLVYYTLYFRKLLSYTGNFELVDLVAKLIRSLKEGVWGIFNFFSLLR